MSFPFERLDVWHEAIDYAEAVYITTDRYPTEERFELRSQLRRAASSVSANIAEGSSRDTVPAKLKYMQDAYGSLMETISHLELSRRRHLINDEQYRRLYERADRIGRMLSGLRRSLKAKPTS